MIIAVNTRFLLDEYLEGYGYFLREVLKRITSLHPEHQFLFIFDRPYSGEFIFNDNVTAIIAGPAARHPLLWKWWYDVKIPAILRKYKADVFVSVDGFCSLRTRVPQYLVVHDLAFLHFPDFISKSHALFYKRYTPLFLKKAAVLSTVSAFSREDIFKNYPGLKKDISLVYNAARDGFRPLDEEEKEKVRDQYAEGRNYFLYTGSIHPRKNLMSLLKAFSVFKKRQKSDWKLLLAGRMAWKNDQLKEALKTYKYRKDVLLTGYLPEAGLCQVMGAAYALVYPSVWEGFGVPVLEAMACEVPVITSAGSAMEEIAMDAALYADPEQYQDIADKMMELYKNESVRSRLILRGREVTAKYTWDDTAGLFWQNILMAVGRKV